MKIYQRGKTWCVNYIDPRTGDRIRKTVGPSKAQAEDVLAKIRTTIIEKGYFDKAEAPRTLFADFIPEYMAWAKANKASWMVDERHLARFALEWPGKMLSEITPAMIEQYKSKRCQAALVRGVGIVSKSEVDHELAILKAFFYKAIKWGKAISNPVKQVGYFKVDNTRHKYLDQKQIGALLAGCVGRQAYLKPIITLALNTGMRKGEILALRWQDIDYKNRVIYIRQAKSGEGRQAPMNNAVMDALRSRMTVESVISPNPESFVFCHGNGARLKSMQGGFNIVMEQAGIRGFRFHDLRHTFASHLAASGVEILVLKELLGHKTLTMTLRYSHLMPGRKHEAVDRLNAMMGAVDNVSRAQNGHKDTSGADTQGNGISEKATGTRPGKS